MIDLSKFSDTTILVIGDLMLDQYWWGDVTRISPEAPVPIVKLERSTSRAGGAANVAANIAGLGAKVILIGVTGNDAEGDSLVSILNEIENVTVKVSQIASKPTSVKTRIVAHNQQVVRLDRESTASLSGDEESVVLSMVNENMSSCDAIVVSDYAKGTLSEILLARLIAAALEHDRMVFVDPKGKNFRKYAGATVVTPNLGEATTAAALETGEQQAASKAGKHLIADLGATAILVTEGEHGMTLIENSGSESHFDAAARQVFDVTGAGDTVISTLAVAAASGASLVDASRLANIAAGIVVGKIGTAVVSKSELEAAYNLATSAGTAKTV